MPSLLLPSEILSMTAQAARRLLEAGDGDCALLYLALLESGGDGERARSSLGWDGGRFGQAAERLAALELVDADRICQAEGPPERDEPPVYTRRDMAAALEEKDFRGLTRSVEDCLGRPLSDADCQRLLDVYDELALPCEVILTLTQWCVSETERKLGKGRRPRMSEVKKEARRWKRQGVVTPERAEEFLRRQEAATGRERELLPLLDIRDRAAVAREREYLLAWVEMGFADDAIRLAYERTIFQKQSLNWAYMNSILKRWHQAGLHTAEQVEAGDAPPRREGQPQFRRVNGAQPDYRPTPERIQENADWLDEFLKTQEEGA